MSLMSISAGEGGSEKRAELGAGSEWEEWVRATEKRGRENLMSGMQRVLNCAASSPHSMIPKWRRGAERGMKYVRDGEGLRVADREGKENLTREMKRLANCVMPGLTTSPISLSLYLGTPILPILPPISYNEVPSLPSFSSWPTITVT